MSDKKITPTKATKWFNSGEWAGGLSLKAHESTDVLEFYSQYSKNPAIWDKAFAFLKDRGNEGIAPGKYEIEGDNVYASVSEGNTKAPEDARWEAHRKYIDIQCVVQGSELIAVAPLSKAINPETFNTEKDVVFFDVPESAGKYYKAEPGIFFVFFQQDAHRPGIRSAEDTKDKKIVIKIKVQ